MYCTLSLSNTEARSSVSWQGSWNECYNFLVMDEVADVLSVDVRTFLLRNRYSYPISYDSSRLLTL
jgi:hypothetical protein